MLLNYPTKHGKITERMGIIVKTEQNWTAHSSIENGPPSSPSPTNWVILSDYFDNVQKYQFIVQLLCSLPW